MNFKENLLIFDHRGEDYLEVEYFDSNDFIEVRVYIQKVHLERHQACTNIELLNIETAITDKSMADRLKIVRKVQQTAVEGYRAKFGNVAIEGL